MSQFHSFCEGNVFFVNHVVQHALNDCMSYFIGHPSPPDPYFSCRRICLPDWMCWNLCPSVGARTLPLSWLVVASVWHVLQSGLIFYTMQRTTLRYTYQLSQLKLAASCGLSSLVPLPHPLSIHAFPASIHPHATYPSPENIQWSHRACMCGSSMGVHWEVVGSCWFSCWYATHGTPSAMLIDSTLLILGLHICLLDTRHQAHETLRAISLDLSPSSLTLSLIPILLKQSQHQNLPLATDMPVLPIPPIPYPPTPHHMFSSLVQCAGKFTWHLCPATACCHGQTISGK